MKDGSVGDKDIGDKITIRIRRGPRARALNLLLLQNFVGKESITIDKNTYVSSRRTANAKRLVAHGSVPHRTRNLMQDKKVDIGRLLNTLFTDDFITTLKNHENDTICVSQPGLVLQFQSLFPSLTFSRDNRRLPTDTLN